MFGLVFNGSACLQNAVYNPIQTLTVSAVFTVIGIVLFGGALLDCLHSLYRQPEQFYKLRVFIKALLLSLSHISPIYLFSAAILLDGMCILI